MNYFAAREIKDKEGKPTGRWHYTRMNDGVVTAVGYCSAWQTCPHCDGRAGLFQDFACAFCAASPRRGLVHVETPCPGHPTPEGACEHMTKYVLDRAKWVREYSFDKHHPQFCAKCDEPASGYASLSSPRQGDRMYFCALHLTREDLAKAVGTIGEVWAS